MTTTPSPQAGAAGPMEPTTGRLIPALIIFVTSLLLFSPALMNGFVDFDDPTYVVENDVVLRGLTTDGIAWAFTTNILGNWHPITWISHQIDASAFGSNPAGHHATNVILHAVNAALLFLLLFRMTGKQTESLLAAAFFALHPLRVESVAWVSERKDLLCGLFVILAALAYHAWTYRRTAGRYAVVVSIFALALMSKPMAVTFPFLLLLFDAWPLGRLDVSTVATTARGLRPLVVEKIPLFLLSVVSCAITAFMQTGHGATNFARHALSTYTQYANVPFSIVRYLGKTLWPAKLAVFYPHPGEAIGVVAPLLSVLLIVAVTVVALRTRKTHPFFAIGWFAFVGMLVPVIGIVQVGGQAMADRYTYLPSIGLSLIFVWGGAALAEKFGGRKAWGAAAVVALVALSAVSWRQLAVWRNSETLHKHAIAVTEGNFISNYNLGTQYLLAGRTAEAEKHLTEAVKILPGYLDARVNLGTALASRGALSEAETHLGIALRINPRAPSALFNMGNVMSIMGRRDEAARYYTATLSVFPGHAKARAALAEIGAAGAGRREGRP